MNGIGITLAGLLVVGLCVLHTLAERDARRARLWHEDTRSIRRARRRAAQQEAIRRARLRRQAGTVAGMLTVEADNDQQAAGLLLLLVDL